MVYVTPQSEIDKYFESENLSQSQLKGLLGGLDKYLENQEEEETLYYKEKGNFIIGSATDCILTGEEGRFDDSYFISDIEKKPSDAEMSMINMVFDDIINTYPEQPIKSLDQYPGFVENSIEFHGWQPKWKMETKIAKIFEVGNEYFENLKLSLGKQVIDKTQYMTIMEIVNSLRTNQRTATYFDRPSYEKNIDVDVYYQLPIYFEYRGIPCKALLDMLFVYKAEKMITKVIPVDLKTMNGNTINFLSSLKSFRYDIQGAWYTEALINESSSFNIGEEFAVDNFRFVVESTSKPGTPLIYEIDKELLHIGKYGRSAVNTVDMNILFSKEDLYQPITMVKEIKGFDSLVDDYLYYQENEWKEERVVTENNGVLKIGWEGIM